MIMSSSSSSLGCLCWWGRERWVGPGGAPGSSCKITPASTLQSWRGSLYFWPIKPFLKFVFLTCVPDRSQSSANTVLQTCFLQKGSSMNIFIDPYSFFLFFIILQVMQTFILPSSAGILWDFFCCLFESFYLISAFMCLLHQTWVIYIFFLFVWFPTCFIPSICVSLLMASQTRHDFFYFLLGSSYLLWLSMSTIIPLPPQTGSIVRFDFVERFIDLFTASVI